MSKKKPKKSKPKQKKQAAAPLKKKEEATPQEKKEGRIHPIDKFNEWVRNHCKQGMVYRGLKNSNWDLDASLYRCLKNKEANTSRQNMSRFTEATNELIKKAAREGHDQKDGIKMNDLQLLAELQHIGAATCLIDFTYNPLIALWFACRQVTDGQSDKNPYVGGKVVALNTIPEKVPGKFTFPKKLKSVDSRYWKKDIQYFLKTGQLWKWSPSKQIPRIIAQQSVFILGKGVIENKEIDQTHFVSKETKESILIELKKQGISEDFLFCDFAGFAQQNSYQESYQELTSGDYLDFAIEEQLEEQPDNLKKAIEYCTKALGVDSRNADAYFTRGFIKGRMRDFDGAIADLSKVIQIYERHYDAHCFRAAAKTEKREYKSAIEDYDKADNITPDTVAVHYYRGLAQYRLGNYEEAEKDYRKAKELGPDDPDIIPYNTYR